MKGSRGTLGDQDLAGVGHGASIAAQSLVRADALARWLDDLIANGDDRVLPFDSRAARIAGELSDQAVATGRHPGFADVAIAAIAVANGLKVLTRNGKHFAPLGVAIVDPADGLPG